MYRKFKDFIFRQNFFEETCQGQRLNKAEIGTVDPCAAESVGLIAQEYYSVRIIF